MKVVIIGEQSSLLDEGMKKSAYKIFSKLSLITDVRFCDLRSPIKLALIVFIKQPHIIHYIPGPSFHSFVIGKILKLLSPRSKIILSAIHPSFFFDYKLAIVRLLRPDLMIVHSKKTGFFFKKLQMKTFFLPWGVDLKKFKPISNKERTVVRKQFLINSDDFVVLHVGHLKKGRNIDIISFIPDVTKIIIGSPSFSENFKFSDTKDMIIIRKYIKNIEKVYGIADCYIFPTISKKDAVEIPLSVIEAMACNIPVVTTRFGGLPDIIEEGSGCYYFKDKTELISLIRKIKELKHNSIKINNRQLVMYLSWDNVCKRLLKIYESLILDNFVDDIN